MIDYELITSQGERRKNEDNVRIVDKGALKAFILADGLGGQGLGDIASRKACDSIEKFILENDFDENMLKNCFKIAQDAVLAAQNECDYFDMRTTLVVLLIYKGKAYFAHIGDSRLYLFDCDKYKYHSSDHSVPQVLVNLGEIMDKDIRHHPERNRLLRALGSSETEDDKLCDIDGERIEVLSKSFLLCSDGFWEWIEEKDMEKMLKKSSTASTWLNMMCDKVLENGINNNMDNFSAIAVIC